MTGSHVCHRRRWIICVLITAAIGATLTTTVLVYDFTKVMDHMEALFNHSRTSFELRFVNSGEKPEFNHSRSSFELRFVNNGEKPEFNHSRSSFELRFVDDDAKADKICVCMFGQVKHYEHVSASVQQHVFDVLAAANFSFDVYAHTYNMSTFTNPRNKEGDNAIDPASLQRNISNAFVVYDAPEDADQYFNLSRLLIHGDPWPENPRLSVRNLGRQLHSLRRVTQLWLPQRSQYKYCIYLRPDVLFVSDLDLPKLIGRLNESFIATPRWHKWGGLNDRLAFGVPSVMELYGLRGEELERYVTHHRRKPHAESFLAFHMRSHGVVNVDSSTKFLRVRADGRIADQISKLSRN